MTIVAQLLREKGHAVWSIAPEASVYEALKLMVEKDIEVLAVVEGKKLVGLLSDREYARNLNGQCGRDIRVQEIMIEKVFCVHPEQTIEECMALMIGRHIRYLPVLADDRLIGVISIHDVVKAVLSRRQEFVIRQPERRMTGHALN